MFALTTLFLTLPVGLIATQAANDELAGLRQFLELPESTRISVAAVPRLPSANPMRVLIATGLDLGVRQNFLKWVGDWNRQDAKKHGRIELVADAASADVILARVTSRDQAKTATETGLGTGVVYDPRSQSYRPAPYARQYSYTAVPVTAYVLARPAPGSLELVWRYATETTVEESKESGKKLWEDFKILLKSRGNAAR